MQLTNKGWRARRWRCTRPGPRAAARVQSPGRGTDNAFMMRTLLRIDHPCLTYQFVRDRPHLPTRRGALTTGVVVNGVLSHKVP